MLKNSSARRPTAIVLERGDENLKKKTLKRESLNFSEKS